MLHLIQVAVVHPQSIQAGGRKSRIPARVLKLGNHLFSPTGVARNREAGHRVVRRQHPQFHQRGCDGEKSGRMAPGIGYPLGEADALALAGEQFRKAVHPALCGPVGRGRVQQTGFGIFHQDGGLPCGLTGQAEQRQIRHVQQLLPLLHIPALLRVDEQQLQVVPPGQQGINLCPHHAAFSINKDLRFSRHHRSVLCSNVRSPGRPAFSVLIVPRFPAIHNGQAGISVGPGWRAVGGGKSLRRPTPSALLQTLRSAASLLPWTGRRSFPHRRPAWGPRFDKNARRK